MNERDGAAEITVWLSELPAIGEAELSAYRTILNAEERQRYDRYKVEGARTEYLAGRALVRTVLSRHADIAPGDWRFQPNRYGRPAVAPEQADAAPGLVFNLSHTRGLVALAVGRHCDLGVDVEWIARSSDLRGLTDRYFAPDEAAHARAAGSDDELTERFFAFWTLKEAYIKARGMGLALPLDGFSYSIDAEPIAIGFTDACPDDPGRWRFLRREVGAEHRLAIAVSTASDFVDVRFRKAVPMREETIEEIGSTRLDARGRAVS
ncbi:4'-phosphopantetheinyl transferase family protein [Jiella marina]|uniref:4'-phosphopantetheinyl transferase family protein n=1 Tax=Jiella sp. LLJ827 TaxID=2917712 RepID=UPI002100C887|nr:4'-phosphopantetheinyl transferase superfamily protein [Jiella sp. LLJ827]MCQ0989450.1 4'-phosphopantetheinyl transferase superfamily protein [Jiella sp. LLJ827]